MPETKNQMMRVRVSDLRIHPSAQRALVPANLRKMKGERLNLNGIGIIHVVQYMIGDETALWVVDGQHRVVALLREGYGDLVVDVMFHPDVKDDAAAHELFLVLNDRATMAAYDVFNNEFGAKKAEAVRVVATVKDNGFRVSRNNGDGAVTCVNTLKSLYRKDDGGALEKTLHTVAAAWGHTANAVEGKVLEGLGLVFATYNGKVEIPALVKKLAKYPGGPAALHGNAKGMKAYRKASVGRCVAELVVEAYNSGRRSGQLEAL